VHAETEELCTLKGTVHAAQKTFIAEKKALLYVTMPYGFEN